jgi:pimeloyl-ACP methyl ester carboxylesterase
VPGAPIRNAADYAGWLTASLDALGLRRVTLIGMSYGGWLALNYALASPERLERLVLLSPGGGFIPLARQFSLRGMLMVWVPTRFSVNTFMRWLGFTGRDSGTKNMLELMYLGEVLSRSPETLRVLPSMFADDQPGASPVP